jgi:O-methyltransferase
MLRRVSLFLRRYLAEISSPVDNRKKFSLAQALSRSVLVPLDSISFIGDSGNCFVCLLPDGIPAAHNQVPPFGSGVRLFEDGVELGPRVFDHDQIRNLGGGRFSHWLRYLYFSSRDNVSPIDNGRSYQLLIPADVFAAKERAYAPWLDGIETQEMPVLERLRLAQTLYRSLWPNTVFPDHGRRIDHDQDFARQFVRLSAGAAFTHERKYNLDQLFQLARHIDGDVAECGVYKGASAYYLARHIVEFNLAKKLCLFDSFEGLSVPADTDGDYWDAGALASSPDDVRCSLAPLGHLECVELFKGWIPERFGEVSGRRFCFVHIDVDLHQPTLDSIAFFYPRMVLGGIILLDDYGFQQCPGATEAIDKFMADKPEPIVNLASGGAFIMKTGGSPPISSG